jgi:hypothetical protein
VTAKGSLFGQINENVWHVYHDGVPTLEQLQGIAEIFATAYPLIIGPLSGALTYNEITCRYIGAAEAPEYTLAFSPPVAGGQTAAESSPSNVCLCVSLRTGLSGRRFRGRKYFSGIPEGMVTSNVINSDLCDELVTAINDLIAALATNETPLAVVSLVQLTVTFVVTAICVDLFVDSQRRRLTGRGR